LPKKETDSKEEKYKLDDFISIQTIKDALLGVQKDKKDLPKKYQYLGKIEANMQPKDLFKDEYVKKLMADNFQSFLNVWKSEFEKCLDEYEVAIFIAIRLLFSLFSPLIDTFNSLKFFLFPFHTLFKSRNIIDT
jgi:hypothetical protein